MHAYHQFKLAAYNNRCLRWLRLACIFPLLSLTLLAIPNRANASSSTTEPNVDRSAAAMPEIAGKERDRTSRTVVTSASLAREGSVDSTIGIAVGVGYGLPIGPARGSDLEEVRYFALFPSWTTPLVSGLGDSSWYRGNLQLTLEGALLTNRRPDTGYAAGGTALLHYEFLRRGSLVPYVEFGVGFVFVNFDLDRQHDGFNFTPQAGVGIELPVTEETSVTAGWRFHHISNAGLRRPNTGLDDSLFLIGFRHSLGR